MYRYRGRRHGLNFSLKFNSTILPFRTVINTLRHFHKGVASGATGLGCSSICSWFNTLVDNYNLDEYKSPQTTLRHGRTACLINYLFEYIRDAKFSHDIHGYAQIQALQPARVCMFFIFVCVCLRYCVWCTAACAHVNVDYQRKTTTSCLIINPSKTVCSDTHTDMHATIHLNTHAHTHTQI